MRMQLGAAESAALRHATGLDQEWENAGRRGSAVDRGIAEGLSSGVGVWLEVENRDDDRNQFRASEIVIART